MDTPYYGTSISGGKEQVIKPGSTVTLSCKSVIIGPKPDDLDDDVRRVSWYKDNDNINDKVSDNCDPPKNAF